LKLSGAEDGLRGGGNIAVRLLRRRLSAPAEEKGTALALYYTPIDSRPKSGEIIDGRDH
jgi:hypothetical protein